MRVIGPRSEPPLWLKLVVWTATYALSFWLGVRMFG